jgi:hypothetical protein
MSKVERASNIRCHWAVLMIWAFGEDSSGHMDWTSSGGNVSPRKLPDADTPKAPYCRRCTTQHGPPTDAGADEYRRQPYR